MAYELELPSGLEFVHPVFHVSMLRKCIGDPYRVDPVEDVQITEDLSYEETPVAILDRQDMPPQRAYVGRNVGNNMEPEVPHVPVQQVSHVEFRTAFQVLTQALRFQTNKEAILSR
ncbi:uncharacterized protein LOC125842765 [Solanum stenotomum]|uniref:uncharacterized protein LOC125842765 n=1 Tax=Solanum stenotomum TaxID=172797 RepID=UPI0020D03583|nr:uncharacterized protein LOC125842765 [Solanum stenotomum]